MLSLTVQPSEEKLPEMERCKNLCCNHLDVSPEMVHTYTCRLLLLALASCAAIVQFGSFFVCSQCVPALPGPMCILHLQAAMPIVGLERVVFYREQGSSTYDAWAFGLVASSVELPYILVQVGGWVRGTSWRRWVCTPCSTEVVHVSCLGFALLWH
jgi:hypothetical protein